MVFGVEKHNSTVVAGSASSPGIPAHFHTAFCKSRKRLATLIRFLATLQKIEYKGIVSFEYEKDAADPLPGLAKSVGYVRGVLAGL